MFSNPRLLYNIHDAKRTLTLHSNERKAIATKKGDQKGYGKVWYHVNGIANILPLNKSQNKTNVTYDSSLKTDFIVNKEDGMNHVMYLHLTKKGYFSLMLKVKLLMS